MFFPKFIKIMPIIIVSATLIVLTAWKIIDNFLTEKYSPRYRSDSIKESRENKKLIKEGNPIPTEIQVDNFVIKIKECWIEERTQIYHDFLFIRRAKKLGSYYLCFTLDNSLPHDRGGSYQFWREGADYGFAESGSFLYSDELPSLDFVQRGIKIDILRREPSVIKSKKIAEIIFSFKEEKRSVSK